MKKISFLVLALATVGIVNAQILNPSFEQWTTQGAFENPTSWETSNVTVNTGLFPITIETVTKNSDAQQGSYAAKLTSVSPMGFSAVAPGLLTLGTFNLDIMAQTGTVSGGVPCTDRPTHFNGFFKYEPQGSDSCFIACVLFKWNATTQSPDTVGAALFTSADNITSWTAFNIPFTYNSSETPDTMNVIIMSSDGRYTPVVNSTLYIDNLSITSDNSSVSDIDNTAGSLPYPNPSAGYVRLSNLKTGTEISIYNNIGQVVKSLQVESINQTVNMSSLPQGNYIISFVDTSDILQRRPVVLGN